MKTTLIIGLNIMFILNSCHDRHDDLKLSFMGQSSSNQDNNTYDATLGKEDVEDYSLPPYRIYLTEADRGKELKREKVIEGVRYRLLYAPSGEYNTPQGYFIVPDLGQNKFNDNLYEYHKKYRSKIKKEKNG